MKHLSFLVLCNAWHQQAMHVIGGLVHSHPCHIDNSWEFSCRASDVAFRAPAVTYWPWHALAVLLINSYLRTDAHPEIEFNFAHPHYSIQNYTTTLKVGFKVATN